MERARGFPGWHERGYLPHCDFPGLLQFITFRLDDSMPASRRGAWEHLLAIEDVREKRTRREEDLDRGVGECWLGDPRVGKLCEDALIFFHHERYEGLAWCVRPKHVHVLGHVWQTPLGKRVQSGKRHTVTQAEAYLAERRSPTRHVSTDHINAPARRAALPTLQWERKFWDPFMRDEAQEKTATRSIAGNPVQAKLCRPVEEWKVGRARFRDQYRRLILSKESS